MIPIGDTDIGVALCGFTFIIEGNANFPLEISKNKDVIFFSH